MTKREEFMRLIEKERRMLEADKDAFSKHSKNFHEKMNEARSNF